MLEEPARPLPIAQRASHSESRSGLTKSSLSAPQRNLRSKMPVLTPISSSPWAAAHPFTQQEPEQLDPHKTILFHGPWHREFCGCRWLHMTALGWRKTAWRMAHGHRNCASGGTTEPVRLNRGHRWALYNARLGRSVHSVPISLSPWANVHQSPRSHPPSEK